MRLRLVINLIVGQAVSTALLASWLGKRGGAHPLIDGLFLSGMAVLLFGLVRVVQLLGLFDVASFSVKRMQAISRRQKSGEPIDESLRSAAEYTQSKPRPGAIIEFLLAGALFIVASFLLTLA